MAGFSFEVSSISVVPEGGSFAHSVLHSAYEYAMGEGEGGGG